MSLTSSNLDACAWLGERSLKISLLATRHDFALACHSQSAQIGVATIPDARDMPKFIEEVDADVTLRIHRPIKKKGAAGGLPRPVGEAQAAPNGGSREQVSFTI